MLEESTEFKSFESTRNVGPAEPHFKANPGKHYLLRKKEGHDISPRLFYPHELLEKFYEYEQWVMDNPLYQGILHQKSGGIVAVPKARAMSIKAFCLYIGIGQTTFYQYAKDPTYREILQVIEDAVYVQKFEYASAGLLNSNLIARDLGLGDSVKHTLVDERKTVNELFPAVEDIDAIEVHETTPEEVKRLNEENNVDNNKGRTEENQ